MFRKDEDANEVADRSAGAIEVLAEAASLVSNREGCVQYVFRDESHGKCGK